MKMFWFFTAKSEIPWAFKLCGIFQMCCDLFLGVQYFIFGDGPAGAQLIGGKAHSSPVDGLNIPSRANGYEMGRRSPLGEKDIRLG
jgi:hypothetical protein